jgi:hypothetical protein
MKLKPLNASEKLLAGPPYRGCGISSDWHGQWLATNGESGMNKYGRLKRPNARRDELQRGWDAFATQVPPDPNGWVDQGDIPLIRRAMWGDDCEQPFIGQLSVDEVWKKIGSFGVSIALDTAAVRATDAIRDHVDGVPHQVLAWRKSTRGGVRRVKIICPMHPQSDAYTGHWVKWKSLKTCALAIKDANDEAFVILYPVGKWTREALVRASRPATIKRLMERLSNKDDRITELKAAITERDATIASLKQQWADAQSLDSVEP